MKICRDGPTIGVGSYSTPTDMSAGNQYNDAALSFQNYLVETLKTLEAEAEKQEKTIERGLRMLFGFREVKGIYI